MNESAVKICWIGCVKDRQHWTVMQQLQIQPPIDEVLLTFTALFSQYFLKETFFPHPFPPVCHHWDHCNLCVGWVSKVLEEAQSALHSGLLHLLLHPGVPNDHRGMEKTHIHLFFEGNISAAFRGHEKEISSLPSGVKHGRTVENVTLELIYVCVLNRMGCTCCSWWTRLQPPTRWSLLPFLSWWESHTFMVSQSDSLKKFF